MMMLVVMVSPMDKFTVWLVGETDALTFSPTLTGTSKVVMYIPVLISRTSMVMVSMLFAGAMGSVVTESGNFTMWSVSFDGWLATSAGTSMTVVDGMMLEVENETSHPSGTPSVNERRYEVMLLPVLAMSISKSVFSPTIASSIVPL